MPLRTVQLYGNFAAHPSAEPHALNQQFILPCLISLAQVVNWYFAEFLKVPLPAELLGKMDYKFSGNVIPSDVTIHFSPSATTSVPYELCETFGDLLNLVWIGLKPAPPPFTYGWTWVLRNSTGRDFHHARKFIGVEHGKPVEDLRTLGEVGIQPGECLSVVRLRS